MFGADWQDAFDLVITFAQKPSFFTETPEDRPFEIQEETRTWKEAPWLPSEPLKENKVVAGGTYKALCKHLSELPQSEGKAGVYFFGDHLWGDVGATRRYTDWEPVAVVEEVQYRQCEEEPGPCPSPQWGCLLHQDSAEDLSRVGEGIRRLFLFDASSCSIPIDK